MLTWAVAIVVIFAINVDPDYIAMMVFAGIPAIFADVHIFTMVIDRLLPKKQ